MFSTQGRGYDGTIRRAIPWNLILFFISFLLFFHLVLHEFSPWESGKTHSKSLDRNGSPGANTVDENVPVQYSEHKPKGKGNPAMYPPDSKEEYVAICMAVKDVHQDLKEVLVHHYHHLGIRRFYLMDDGSEPPLSTYDDWGIPREHITFHYFDQNDERPVYMQNTLYEDCIDMYRDKHTWMAFLDADEMLEMTGEETLTELLKRMEKNRSIGALAVNWATHTSNGHLARPESARKAFTDCLRNDIPSQDEGIKSIVKTEFYAGQNGPHMAALSENTKTVGEDGIEIPPNSRVPVTRDRIALHHYSVKSRQEFVEKMQRGNAMDDPKPWSYWDATESAGGRPCPEMAMYEP